MSNPKHRIEPRRVLVTGASGFIGCALVRHLSLAGYHVIAASRSSSVDTPTQLNITHVTLPDISKAFDANALVSGMDAVVHLAGIAHSTARICEAQYQSINADATRRFASAASAAKVPRFVFMSSVRAQSGATNLSLISESSRSRPTDAYGRSKLEAENCLAEVLSGSPTDYVVLRPVVVYGAGVKGNMATLVRLAKLPVPLPFGGVDARRSIVSIGNLVSAVRHALGPETPSATYLVADEAALTAAEIITALRAGLGRKPWLLPVPKAVIAACLKAVGRGPDIERLLGSLVVNTQRLKATGWRPAEDSRAALAKVMVGSDHSSH